MKKNVDLGETLVLITVITLFIIIALASWLLSIVRAEGPDILPLECGIERVTPLSDYVGENDNANGLTFYKYDTNHDGKVDVQIATPIGDENRYPLFYSFDRTYNGDADITYVDQVRDGTCGGVQVYWTRKGGFLQPDYFPDYRGGV